MPVMCCLAQRAGSNNVQLGSAELQTLCKALRSIAAHALIALLASGPLAAAGPSCFLCSRILQSPAEPATWLQELMLCLTGTLESLPLHGSFLDLASLHPTWSDPRLCCHSDTAQDALIRQAPARK